MEMFPGCSFSDLWPISPSKYSVYCEFACRKRKHGVRFSPMKVVFCKVSGNSMEWITTIDFLLFLKCNLSLYEKK